jgi:hypothetical protein
MVQKKNLNKLTFLSEFRIASSRNASEGLEQLDLQEVIVFEYGIAEKRLNLSVNPL